MPLAFAAFKGQTLKGYIQIWSTRCFCKANTDTIPFYDKPLYNLYNLTRECEDDNPLHWKWPLFFLFNRYYLTRPSPKHCPPYESRRSLNCFLVNNEMVDSYCAHKPTLFKNFSSKCTMLVVRNVCIVSRLHRYTWFK